MYRRRLCQAMLLGSAAAPLLSRSALAQVYAGLTAVDRDLEALTLAGTEQTLAQAAVQELADSLRGPLLLPGNAAYNAARLVLNPEIDKYPALIVQPSGAADVMSAVQFARENQLLVAVKCGGHSSAGKSTCDGGLMIDLSGFRNVRIDRDNQSAHITGGSLLGQLDHESMAQGLVTTSGTVSHTGVGGLATAGGFGRLGRRFGLTLDNIRAVDVVAADGKLYRASAEENPDLHWAVRGGGGNFGVVTSFELALHPMQRQVLGGSLYYTLDRAREVAEVYAQYSVESPDEVYTDLLIVHPPGGRTGFVQIAVCYSGAPDQYERAMQPYLKLGKPLKNTVTAVDYVALQRSSDNTDPRAFASYLKGGFTDGISQALIEQMVAGVEPHPKRMTMAYLQHAGGAIGRVGAADTAFPHRYATHNMFATVGWPAGESREPHVSWVKQYWSELAAHTRGFYSVDVNEEAAAEVNRNYQGNYARLVEIKKRYDPDNLFRLNANITPGPA